ncbi:MAG: response regulator transcription factor [Bacteroidota bacterium]|jgi:DNA-binding NarL/FixJ family response regulator
MEKRQNISVAIVEDLTDIRVGLGALIGGSPGFSCIGMYADGEEAVERIPRAIPDVVLMDIDMPKMNGIECIRKLKTVMPSLQIMMLTVFEDDEKIFQSLKAGASGYLLKKTPPVKLLEAIEEVFHGGSPMSGQIARKVIQAFQTPQQKSPQTENLSQREHEILSYLAKGHRYKEIADELFISIETVRTHIRNIYEKLHVRSRTEAVLKYLNK